MLYVSTRREFWRMSHTGGRFFGTAAVLGPAAFLMAGTLFPFPGSLLTAVALALMLATAIKLSLEARFLRHVTVDLNDSSLTQLQRSVWLLQGPLGALSRGGQMCAFMGGIILPLFWLIGASSPAIPVSAFGICLLAELIERHLFFAAMAPAKMPGAS
jgi:DMSO reductase anchor subunit